MDQEKNKQSTARGAKKAKLRLDIALIDKGLFDNRKEAQAAIMDGAVLVNNQKVTKPGVSVSSDDCIELRPGFARRKYVSRGGYKLEKAIEQFAIDVQGRICLDIGASTGGFTDCLLKNGAARVYAIDVGYGQLDWSLRHHDRVTVLEKTNARYLSASDLYKDDEPPASLAVIDCSFISLSKIVPAVINLLDARSSEIVCLVKPQFEAGRRAVVKGVVKDADEHKHVLEEILSMSQSLGLKARALTYSPIKGPKGNIEYLILLDLGKTEAAGHAGRPPAPLDVDALVHEAVKTLQDKRKSETSDDFFAAHEDA